MACSTSSAGQAEQDESKPFSAVARFVKVWLPQVGICLLLQGGLIGGGLVLHRWIIHPVPLCWDQPQGP